MVECPHCGKEFQEDEYYEIKRGDEFECHKCEKVIHVIETYTEIHIALSTEKDE